MTTPNRTAANTDGAPTLFFIHGFLDDATIWDGVIAALERGAELAGSAARRMPSGAGHDGMIVGRHIPAGMLFAPSIGGRSHSEAEDTEPADLVLAATALANGIAELLGR